MEPVVVVAPGIDETIALDGDVIDHRMEHLLAIDLKDGLADAKMIAGGLHIVVGTQGKTHLAPGCERLRETET